MKRSVRWLEAHSYFPKDNFENLWVVLLELVEGIINREIGWLQFFLQFIEGVSDVK